MNENKVINDMQVDSINLVASYLEISMKILDQCPNIHWNDENKKIQAVKHLRNIMPELSDISDDEINNLYHLGRDYHRLDIISVIYQS